MTRISGDVSRVVLFVLLSVLIPGSWAAGEVVRVEVERREVVLDGRVWGDAGAYEKLVGKIYFAFDPDNPVNSRVVDIQWAPRNGEGMVEAWADFMVLQPLDPSRRRGVAWLEVSNRGGKIMLSGLNRAATRSLDPRTEEDFGDGLLLEEGLTLIWVGWQWDVPDGEGVLRLHVPVARLPGSTIEGLVRSDWTVDRDTESLELGSSDHRAYVPVAADHPDNTLTVRQGRETPREVIARDHWWFLPALEGQQEGQLTRVVLEGGFRAGNIYELVYRSQDPRVVGLGLAAVRDIISYAKYELESLFPVDLALAFGASQSGRFLRASLYQGFNTDEGGRQVFDGMFIFLAGAGRGSFNHRFGQPSRAGGRYESFFYPTDLFPFTSPTQTDPGTGRSEGLFSSANPDHLPFVFHVNSGSDYWNRAASLIHTSLDGTQDVPPTGKERIFHLAGAQHSPSDLFSPEDSRMGSVGIPAYRGNPLGQTFTLRALSLSLTRWVEGEGEPPASAYPRIGNGTLVPHKALAFPNLPGVAVPKVIHEAHRMDYGPRWLSEGIIERQPPGVGPSFPSLVSQVDGLGNEIAGIRGWELRAPLATYAPWNLRWGYAGGEEELTGNLGTFIPLSRTEEERVAMGDPRPSVEALYGTKEVYLEHVRAATRELVMEGFLLGGDAADAVVLAEARWNWLMSGRS